MPSDWLYDTQRAEIRRWYRLTFVYGGLILVNLALLVAMAWRAAGCG